MATRTFVAPDGMVWQAWNVDPTEHADWPAHARGHLPPALANGWICFESASEKRRLHPVPSGWEESSEVELWGYCSSAEPVRQRVPSPA
jgi:hypothetical protein